MPWELYHQNYGDQQVGWAGQGDSAVRRALLDVRGGDPTWQVILLSPSPLWDLQAQSGKQPFSPHLA